MSQCKVKLLPSNKVLEAKIGDYLLGLLLANKLEVPHSCGGMGTCGTCRILVRSDVRGLALRNEIEAEMAEDRGFAEDERLACQLEIIGDITVECPG